MKRLLPSTAQTQHSPLRQMRSWGWPLLVMGLAAFLRFYRLDLAQFKSDEARALALAISIVL